MRKTERFILIPLQSGGGIALHFTHKERRVE